QAWRISHPTDPNHLDGQTGEEARGIDGRRDGPGSRRSCRAALHLAVGLPSLHHSFVIRHSSFVISITPPPRPPPTYTSPPAVSAPWPRNGRNGYPCSHAKPLPPSTYEIHRH